MVPLLDLRILNAQYQNDIEAAVLRVARSGRYILGREVEAFEEEWAQYCGAAYCVGTGNGLDALHMLLRASDIGPGSEVIVPSNTFFATWLSVSLAGATPVPVDPDPITFNIDPANIEGAITSRTAAIIAVHLYGAPADMKRIKEIGSRHGLAVFADAAHAHGAWVPDARFRGRAMAGALCHAEAFSFYPSKNLGAMGDAGCVVTDDRELAHRISRLRNYGGEGRLNHRVRGINSRMDEMQAAILRAKLPYLDQMNGARYCRAMVYTKHLLGIGVITPDMAMGHAFHQYVIRAPKRTALIGHLASRGIESHIHYPVPPHLEPAYADLHIMKGALPVAEHLAHEILSLPIGNSETNILDVTDAIHSFYAVNQETE